MAKIYHLVRKEKTIREMIHNGRITGKIRSHLQEAYRRHQALYPETPDTEFIRKMLTWEKKLTPGHHELLKEILKYEIREEEHPHGYLDIKFTV